MFITVLTAIPHCSQSSHTITLFLSNPIFIMLVHANFVWKLCLHNRPKRNVIYELTVLCSSVIRIHTSSTYIQLGYLEPNSYNCTVVQVCNHTANIERIYLDPSSQHLGHFIPRLTAVFTWTLAMVQADSHQPLNAEPRVQSQAIACGVSVRHSGTVTGLPLNTAVSFC